MTTPRPQLLAAAGLPEPIEEHRFAPPRRWQFDLAWPRYRVALEIEGGIFGRGKPCPLCKRRSEGAHTSIERLKSDMEKYNAAAIRGWAVIRTTPDRLLAIETVGAVEAALKVRGWRRA